MESVGTARLAEISTGKEVTTEARSQGETETKTEARVTRKKGIGGGATMMRGIESGGETSTKITSDMIQAHPGRAVIEKGKEIETTTTETTTVTEKSGSNCR